jgi:release factor glutamine methyltransferase
MSEDRAAPPRFAPAEARAAALARLREAFAQARLDNPGLDARILVEAACGIDRAALIAQGEARLGPDAAGRLRDFAARRLAREPVARILGAREFWGRDFALSPATLEPRPDSETLIALALARLPADRPATILDLGTGTGCLGLTLLAERPLARGVLVDRSQEAARTARANAERLGVAERCLVVVADWAEAVAGPFDLVISNPPYIESAAIAGLAPEVRRHDPQAALDGGPDGLVFYRRLARDLPRLLTAGGRAIVEIGAGQGTSAPAAMAGPGLRVGPVVPDLAGLPRAILAARP